MISRWVLVHLLSLALLSFCQDSNVTCSTAYDWASNNEGETPCLVSSQLQSLCGRIINVNQIPPGTHYLGPTPEQASQCSCNSVVYSLTSACGMCQGRTIVNWTTWTRDCPDNVVFVGRFPQELPDAIEVPQWAFLNVTAMEDQQWNPFQAREAAEQTASVSSSSRTSTRPSSSQTASPSSAVEVPSTSVNSDSTSVRSNVPTTTAGSGSQTSSSSNAGAIAGGVVGGLVGLVALGLLAFWLLLKKKRKAKSVPPKDFVIDEPSNAMSYTAGTSASPPPVSQRTTSPYSNNIYGVGSPEPPVPVPLHPPPPSEMYTTLTTRRSQESFGASQFGGNYRGKPEV